jgi:hypothetical protein
VVSVPVPLKTQSLTVPYAVPQEYDLLLEVERRQSETRFLIEFEREGSKVGVYFDNLANEGGRKTVIEIQGKPVAETPNPTSDLLLGKGRLSAIFCAVRREGLSCAVNGWEVIGWKAGPSAVPSGARTLRFGCYSASFAVTRIVLTPLSGPGQRLR